MRYMLFIFIFCAFSCNSKTKKSNHIELKKTSGFIYFSFQGIVKDTLKMPNIKLTRYKPVITYTSDSNPYIDSVIIEDSNSKKEAKKLKNENEIIIRHKYRLEDIYFSFKKGDSIIYKDEEGFPVYKIINRKSKFQDLEYEMTKRNYLGNNVHKNFNYFQFSKLMSAEHPQKALKNYLDDIDSDFHKETEFLDSLHFEKKISKGFYIIQKQKIKFDRYNFLLSAKGIDFYQQNIGTLRQEFYNDSLVKYEFFKEFLKKTATYEAISLQHANSGNMAINPKLIYEFLVETDLVQTQSKNFLLYNYLQRIAEEMTLNDFKESYRLFLAHVNSTILLNDIKNRYLVDLDNLKKTANNVHIVNLQKENFTLEEFINKNKGKLIYIDFWASWCAPCRSAMPNSKKLHETYMDKDVVFLYISIDKDFGKWKKASEEENLDLSKNNLLALNYPTANFYKELKLKEIPRYFLYNKKGELIHQNAPGPKSDEISILLNKYLNE